MKLTMPVCCMPCHIVLLPQLGGHHRRRCCSEPRPAGAGTGARGGPLSLDEDDEMRSPLKRRHITYEPQRDGVRCRSESWWW